MAAISRHPMLGPNRLKLGVFSMNTDGGLTLTRVPERWPALWSETVEVAQLADRAGLEFLLPIARWKGFGGEMNSREWSFKTLTHAGGLAGVTQRIGVLATVHVPMVHPVFAAKALATLDHISNGRSGLNIVCGWNPEEFALFGLKLIEDR
jgi:alkanesulfonate monooxygenase SsuD/methylene tetrahydromethanopterin reductase-like flavin-dependent oxidoreductase (luciferase family)